jgi:hypothetical protein
VTEAQLCVGWRFSPSEIDRIGRVLGLWPGDTGREIEKGGEVASGSKRAMWLLCVEVVDPVPAFAQLCVTRSVPGMKMCHGPASIGVLARGAITDVRLIEAYVWFRPGDPTS